MSLFLPRIDAQEIHTGTRSRALPDTHRRARLSIPQLLRLWRARHRHRQGTDADVCARLKRRPRTSRPGRARSPQMALAKVEPAVAGARRGLASQYPRPTLMWRQLNGVAS